MFFLKKFFWSHRFVKRYYTFALWSNILVRFYGFVPRKPLFLAVLLLYSIHIFPFSYTHTSLIFWPIFTLLFIILNRNLVEAPLLLSITMLPDRVAPWDGILDTFTFLNGRLKLSFSRLKAILYVREKGKITNTEYQENSDVSKATATRDLTELVDKYKLLRRIGDIGAGTTYHIIGSIGSRLAQKIH